MGKSRRLIFDCKSFVAGGGRRREGADRGRRRSVATIDWKRGRIGGRSREDEDDDWDREAVAEDDGGIGGTGLSNRTTIATLSSRKRQDDLACVASPLLFYFRIVPVSIEMGGGNRGWDGIYSACLSPHDHDREIIRVAATHHSS